MRPEFASHLTQFVSWSLDVSGGETAVTAGDDRNTIFPAELAGSCHHPDPRVKHCVDNGWYKVVSVCVCFISRLQFFR